MASPSPHLSVTVAGGAIAGPYGSGSPQFIGPNGLPMSHADAAALRQRREEAAQQAMLLASAKAKAAVMSGDFSKVSAAADPRLAYTQELAAAGGGGGGSPSPAASPQDAAPSILANNGAPLYGVQQQQGASASASTTGLVSRFMPPPPPSLQAARAMAVCAFPNGGDCDYYAARVGNADPRAATLSTPPPFVGPSSPSPTITCALIEGNKKADIAALEAREAALHGGDGKTCIALGEFAFLTKVPNTGDWSSKAGYGPWYSSTIAEGAPDTTYSRFDPADPSFQAFVGILMQWYARVVRAVGRNKSLEEQIAASTARGDSEADAAAQHINPNAYFRRPLARMPATYFLLGSIPPCPRPEAFFSLEVKVVGEKTSDTAASSSSTSPTATAAGPSASSSASSSSSAFSYVISDVPQFIRWHDAVHHWWHSLVQPRTVGFHLHAQLAKEAARAAVKGGGNGQGGQQSASPSGAPGGTGRNKGAGNANSSSNKGQNQKGGRGRGGDGGAAGGRGAGQEGAADRPQRAAQQQQQQRGGGRQRGGGPTEMPW